MIFHIGIGIGIGEFLFLLIGIGIGEFVFFILVSVSVSVNVMMSISVSVKWKFPFRSITTYCYILHLKLDIYSSIMSLFKSQTPNPLKSIIVVGSLVQTPLPLTWWLITWKLPYFDKCRNYKSVQVRRDINL